MVYIKEEGKNPTTLNSGHIIFLFTTNRSKKCRMSNLRPRHRPLLAISQQNARKSYAANFTKEFIVWVSPIFCLSLIRRDSIIGETHGRPILAETHFCWKKRLFDYCDLLKKTVYSTLTLLRFCWLFWFFVDFFTFFWSKTPLFRVFTPKNIKFYRSFATLVWQNIHFLTKNQ